jgi:outer membrane protein, heavy metal efflux system
VNRLVMGWLCALVLPAAAQPVPVVLDADTAVARALARHPAIAAARAGAQGAAAQTQSTARLNAPVLKLSADREETGNNGSGSADRKNKLGVEWAPPQWGETTLRLEQLQHNQRQQTHRLDQARQQVALEVRRAHAGAAAFGEMVEASELLRRLSHAMLNRATEQVQQGRRSQQALVDLRVQTLDMESQHQALIAQRSLQEAELRALVGLEPGEALLFPAAAQTPGTPSLPTSDPDAVANAVRQRPEVKAAQARCDAVRADAQLKGLENQRWLKSLGMEHTPRQQGKSASWGLALEFNLPVPGDKNGSVAALQSGVEVCQAETLELQRTVRRDVLAALAQWQAAAREWQVQREQTLPLLQQAVELAKATRRAGRGDALDVLSAEMGYARGRIATLRRQLDLRWAELLWQHAAGRPLADLTADAAALAGGR